MKKIKLLTSLASIATLCGVITPLTSCGISAAEDSKINFTINSISVSKEFYEKVTLTTTKNADGNYDIKFKCKDSRYIVQTIRAVVAGETSLEPDEYCYDILHQTLTIKKSAIEKYKGKALTIIPDQLTLNKVSKLEVTCAKSSVNVGDVLKAEDLTVTAIYTDGTVVKTPLQFGTDYILIDQLSKKANHFDTEGYKFANAGEWELYVVYLKDSSVTTTLKFNVAKSTVQTVTINIRAVNCTVNYSTIEVEIGKTLSEIISDNNIKCSPNDGYYFAGWFYDNGSIEDDARIDAPKLVVKESLNIICYCAEEGGSSPSTPVTGDTSLIVFYPDNIRNFEDNFTYCYSNDNSSPTFGDSDGEIEFVPLSSSGYLYEVETQLENGIIPDLIIGNTDFVERYMHDYENDQEKQPANIYDYLQEEEYSMLTNMYSCSLSFTDSPIDPATISKIYALTDNCDPAVFLYNIDALKLKITTDDLAAILFNYDLDTFVDAIQDCLSGDFSTYFFNDIYTLQLALKQNVSTEWGGYEDGTPYAYWSTQFDSMFNTLKKCYQQMDENFIRELDTSGFGYNDFFELLNQGFAATLVPLSYFRDTLFAQDEMSSVATENEIYMLSNRCNILPTGFGYTRYEKEYYYITPNIAPHPGNVGLFFHRMLNPFIGGDENDRDLVTGTMILTSGRLANDRKAVEMAISDNYMCWNDIPTSDPDGKTISFQGGNLKKFADAIEPLPVPKYSPLDSLAWQFHQCLVDILQENPSVDEFKTHYSETTGLEIKEV